MKRLFLILVAALSLSISASAQKFGHIDTKLVVDVLPDAKNASTALEAEAKKYDTQFQAMSTEYQNKYQAYVENVQLADAAPEKWSAAIRADKEQELMQLQERIGRFQESAQQSLAQKRVELFNPVMDKLQAAIKKVATEGGYIYIFDVDQVRFINESLSTDVTSAVKKELGIN